MVIDSMVHLAAKCPLFEPGSQSDMRRASILLIALAMLLVSAATALANNTWNGYHWGDGASDPHDGGISLALVDDLDDAYGTEYAYAAVLADWDDGPLSLSSSNALPTARPAACDNDASGDAGNAIAGKIHVCNAAYGKNGWLGLARIWLASDGHIEAGVALMNDSYMLESGSLYDDPNARRHVLCQEIGHTFGLDHQGSPKKQSCMNDRWGLTDPSFVGPNQHDYDTLDEIYGSSSGDAEGGGNSKPCNPKSPKCQSGANVHFAPRPGGGWIVTYTVPPGRGLG